MLIACHVAVCGKNGMIVCNPKNLFGNIVLKRCLYFLEIRVGKKYVKIHIILFKN